MLYQGVRYGIPILALGGGVVADYFLQCNSLEATAALSALVCGGTAEAGVRSVRGNLRIAGLQASGGTGEIEQLRKRADDLEAYNRYLDDQLKTAKSQIGISEKAGVRYDAVKELGRGAQAIVLLVLDHALKQPRVLRVPALGEAMRYFRGNLRRFLDRFRAEAENLSKMKHPNIVEFYDFNEMDLKTYLQLTGENINSQDLEGIEKFPYIVMEYVEGQNLRTKLGEFERIGLKGFPLSYAVGIMLDLIPALEEMKAKNVIHRDFKTENIVLTTAGLTKLIDFGIARGVMGAGTVLGSAMGSPGYMSPEQMGAEVLTYLEHKLGRKVEVTWKSDLYGAGATLWELITGRLPFENLERFTDILELPMPRIEAALHEMQDDLVMDLDGILERVDPMQQNDDLRQFEMDLVVLQRGLIGRLQKVFKKTLAIDPAKRYESLEDLENDLNQIRAENDRYKRDLEQFLRFTSPVYAATQVAPMPGKQ